MTWKHWQSSWALKTDWSKIRPDSTA